MNTNGPDLAVPGDFSRERFVLPDRVPSRRSGRQRQVPSDHREDHAARARRPGPERLHGAGRRRRRPARRGARPCRTRPRGVDRPVAGKRDADSTERRDVCGPRHAASGRRADHRCGRLCGARRAAPAAAAVPLEIVATAFDPAAGRKAWPPGAGALVAGLRGGREHRFDALSRIDLPPGEYEVRVAVSWRCAHGERLLLCDRSRLRVGTVVDLEHRGRRDGRDADRAQGLPRRPCCRSCRRRGAIRARRSVRAFFRIYQGTARQDPLAPVQLQSTIVDARGRSWRPRRARSTQDNSRRAGPPITTSPSRSRRWPRATTS